jgi:hypothetical protein
MLFCALHLDDEDPVFEDDGEEVYLVVPDGSKTALAVPLGALSEFLPILERALGAQSMPRCRACGAEVPRLAYQHRADRDAEHG